MEIKLLRKLLLCFAVVGFALHVNAQTNASPILSTTTFGFEDEGAGTYAWEDWDNGSTEFSTATGTIPSTTDDAFVSGSRSMLTSFIYSGVTTTGGVTNLDTYRGANGDFELEAGHYYFSAWIYIVDDGPNKVQLSLDADDVTGFTNYNAINISSVGLNTWTQIGVNITIEPGDDDCWIRIKYQDFPASGTGSIYIDDIELELLSDGTFDDGDATDSDWSTALNWDGSRVVTTVATLAASPDLDVDSSIEKLTTGAETADYAINSTDKKLTITGSASEITLLDNNLDGALTINCDIEFNNADGVVVNSTPTNNQLIFAQGKTVTLSTKIIFKNNHASNPILFKGDLVSAGNLLIVNNGSTLNNGALNFSNTADNSGFLSTLRIYKEGIVSDIVGPNLFLPDGGVFQFQNGGSTPGGFLTINGANSYEGTLNNAKSDNTVYFNANQNSIKSLKTVVGNLTMELGGAVTDLVFNDASIAAGTSIDIINFDNEIVKLSSLSTAELALIEKAGATNQISQIINNALHPKYEYLVNIADCGNLATSPDASLGGGWGTQIDVSWTAPTIKPYEYTLKAFITDPADATATAGDYESIITGTDSAGVITAAVPGTYYNYIVWEDPCETDGTDYAVFAGTTITTGTLGIEDYQQLEGVNIYPNPANNELTIECPYGSEVGVYNLMGVKVKTVKNTGKNFRMSVEELSSGLYIVKVQSEGKFYSKKVQIK